MVQDFSNINMSLNNINAYLKDNGVEVSAEDSAKLNSIFKESDTENAKGEKKADGELSRKERNAFLDKAKSALPKLFEKIVDFATIIDVKEDLEAERKMKQIAQMTHDALNDPDVKAHEEQELERVEKEMQEEQERLEKKQAQPQNIGDIVKKEYEESVKKTMKEDIEKLAPHFPSD